MDRGEFDEDAEDERLLQAKAAEVGGSVWCALQCVGVCSMAALWRSELYYTVIATMLCLCLCLVCVAPLITTVTQ